jgi:hypothetical protein
MPGIYTATLTVSDGKLTSTARVTITVNEPEPHPAKKLNVKSITCFDTVIQTKQQSCSVFIEDENHNTRIGDAHITIKYIGTDEVFGHCMTDSISGGCEATQIMNTLGNFTVYATAEKVNYSSDVDMMPIFKFEVIPQKYEIKNIATYNDSSFTQPDSIFYRGEDMFVKFRATEINCDITKLEELISESFLVSPPGGRIELTRIKFENGWYYYRLTPIPITHSYKGNSQVFAFVFKDGKGGQNNVEVTILNNPPKIINMPDAITINENVIMSFNLRPYESDVEDHGSDLVWSMSYSTGKNFTTDFISPNNERKAIAIIPSGPGEGYIDFTLTDLDGDVDSRRVLVHINAVPQPNVPPDVEIIEPVEGAIFDYDTDIRFVGEAWDVEDGIIPENKMVWTSEIDGEIGTGRLFNKALSPGVHTITLTAMDSVGATSSDTVTITVRQEPVNHTVTVKILKPQNGAKIIGENTVVDFVGEGQDIAGDLSKQLRNDQLKWYSDKQGFLGTGSKITVRMKEGTHKITLIGTNDDGLTAEDSIVLIVGQKQVEDKDETLYVGSIDIYGLHSNENYMATSDDTVKLNVLVENTGTEDLENLRAYVIIPELGIKTSSSSFDLDTGDDKNIELVFDLYHAPKGLYNAKIVIQNEEIKRAKYRDLKIT